MFKGYKLYHPDNKEWYGPFIHLSDLINAAKSTQLTPDEVALVREYKDSPLKVVHNSEYSEIKIYWEKVGEFTIPLEYRDWDYPKFNSYSDPETPRLTKWLWIKFKFYMFCVKVREFFQFL